MTNGIPPEVPNGGIRFEAKLPKRAPLHPYPPLARNYSFCPDAMLAKLKQAFPDRAPGLNTPYQEIMFQAGQVSVVRFIEAELEKDDSQFFQHPF